MPDFTYEALARSGERNTGTISAGSEREAATMLDGRGLFPIKIASVGGAAGGGGYGRVSRRLVATTFSQLADLLHSGVPMLKSLELLERQTTNKKMAAILRDVRMKVADGTGLAQAMAVHPKAFDDLAVSMVRAGQEGGFLEDVLKRISIFLEHQEDLKGKVIGALAYPVFLAGAGFIVLNILVIFFVPKFEPIFKKLEEKGELPFLTSVITGFSHFMTSWLGVLTAAALIGAFFFALWWSRGPGRRTADAIRLKLPMAGGIYRALALSRFTRILGTMLHNGIPILKALSIAKDSTGNKILAEAIEQSAENVTSGQKLADPLRRSKHFPVDVVEMIAIAEESNNLEKVLVDIADGLEKRTARNLELTVKLLEPVMLMVMAAVVLVVVAGLLLPVFKMGSAVG